MDNYTIDEFWIPRLGEQPVVTAHSLVTGWSFEDEGLNTFKEAPLTQSAEQFGSDADPMCSSIVLVSAPGAVGKSTLARQIALITGSIYVDLATADPVGANSLSGGLVRSQIYSYWDKGAVTALIDGLDEATLKTTKEGFEAFLADVAVLSEKRSIPTVLFGRTRAVEDAWLILKDICKSEIAVLEIGYYGVEASVEFAEARLKAAHPNRQHPTVDRTALELLLEGLRSQTASDGDRFAGYAPVLQAVAERVARETNPSGLVSDMQQGMQPPVTLQTIIQAILKRDQNKLGSLPFQDPGIAVKLYSPDEQLDRLVAMVYQSSPPNLPDMLPEDAERYSRALESWLGEHPFLGEGGDASSAVFEAVITARALKSTGTGASALAGELGKGEASNPFLYVFYTGEQSGSETTTLPEEHIGAIYSSIRASLAQGETASLLVEEIDDDQDQPQFGTVEIELSRRGKDNPILHQFRTNPIGPIRLGSHIRDVLIEMPRARVEIGESTEVLLVAPVDIQCADLAISGEKVIVEASPDSPVASVFLEANNYTGTTMTTVPVLRNGAQLSVSWPGATSYPWNSFTTETNGVQGNDPLIDEALRRFRKFIIEFRAHGNGGLARSRLKIDSQRMTKGTGQAVLESMLEAGIITRDQARYYLHTGPLGELTGTTYGDCMAYQFGTKAIDFVQKALPSVSD